MTASFGNQGVRHSRPDEWLRELELNAALVLDDIVRLAVVEEQAWEHQRKPWIPPGSPADIVLPPGIAARWLQAGYTARGQMYRFAHFLGLVADTANPPRVIARYLDAWRTRNRETNEAELEMVRTLRAGIEAIGAFDIRTGGLAVDDPSWAPREDIREPQRTAMCITCVTPIYFANEDWRHEQDGTVPAGPFDTEQSVHLRAGRQEAELHERCPRCRGSGQEGEDRCPACRLHRGLRVTTHHLADPEREMRKV